MSNVVYMDKVWRALIARPHLNDYYFIVNPSTIEAFNDVLNAPWYKKLYWRLRYSDFMMTITHEFD